MGPHWSVSWFPSPFSQLLLFCVPLLSQRIHRLFCHVLTASQMHQKPPLLRPRPDPFPGFIPIWLYPK